MDNHPTLSMLLSSLFSTNSLSNWSIFEDKNGLVNVRLRFTKSEGNVATEPASFRRKSDKQLTRDQDRAARHQNQRARIVTRSRTVDHVEEDTPEISRCPEDYVFSEPAPMISPVNVQLNPEADMYVPDIYNSPCPATRDMPGACNSPCPESCDIPGDSVRTLSESSSAAF